jgi:hypothetical protein
MKKERNRKKKTQRKHTRIGAKRVATSPPNRTPTAGPKPVSSKAGTGAIAVNKQANTRRIKLRNGRRQIGKKQKRRKNATKGTNEKRTNQ